MSFYPVANRVSHETVRLVQANGRRRYRRRADGLCCNCQARPRRPGGGDCKECHAAYMSAYRAEKKKSGEESRRGSKPTTVSASMGGRGFDFDGSPAANRIDSHSEFFF